jgi:hypothetical protein
VSRIIGRGRYATETYPERANGGGGSAPDLPLSSIAFVDYGTVVPLSSQNGFIGTPYATVQQALDAGFTSVYISGFASEDVVAPSFVILTGMDGQSGLNSLTLPDNSGADLSKVRVGTLTAGTTCNVITDRGIDTAVFGAGGILVVNGPGAENFVQKVDQVQLGDITMPSGALIVTNAVFSGGSAVTAQVVEMFGCTSQANVSCTNMSAQNCALTVGTYVTAGTVALQDVKPNAGVVFTNAAGQPFDVDGFTNYWIKTNAVALASPGDKVITEDLTP